jgi:hypothetical protein
MIHDPRLDELIDRLESAPRVETAEVDVSVQELKALLRIDSELFIEFFLGDHLDMAVPEFHKEVWSLATDEEKERILLAIPRDHAKTTIAKLLVVYHWLYTSHRFAVYLSNTNAIAKGACKDIVGYVESQNFQKLWGKVEWVKSSEQESLWVFKLTLAPTRVKTCILRAIGQGQQMRGINIDNQRPDFAVVDDVEDNENTDSPALQAKLDRWMFGPFLKALARKKKILWLGNMLAKTSLLARLSQNPRWNPVVFGSLVKDPVTQQLRPLWPGKWTIESLREDFKEYIGLGLVETWMCEMMNMPGHGANGFTNQSINFSPRIGPDQCEATWLTIDPAFGLTAESDESAIAVHALPKDGSVPITVRVAHGRWSENEMFEIALGLAYEWDCWTWGVESVAAQKVLITLFGVLAALRGMNHPITILPLPAGRGDPKMGRIRGLVSLMTAKDWAIADDEVDFATQLTGINVKSKHNEDDIVDAVAYGPTMMDLYLSLIMSNALNGPDSQAPSAQHGVAVCGV